MTPVLRKKILRVTHVVPSLDPANGGTTTAVYQLVDGLKKEGVIVQVVAVEGKFCDSGLIDLNRRKLPKAIRRFAVFNPAVIVRLCREIKNSDLIHIHTVWNGVATAAGIIARYYCKPVVLTPHGMLEATNIEKRGFAKKLYYQLFEKKNLLAVAGMHYLDQSEARGSRWATISKSGKKMILPNGLDLSYIDGCLHQWSLKFDFDNIAAKNCRNLVFLGRLNKIKGLDIQLRALKILADRGFPVVLHFIGPDDGEKLRLEKLQCDLGINSSQVRFYGPIYDFKRFLALRDADAVLLTSHYECNSVTAAETLAVGGMLVGTKSCNLDKPASEGAAVVVDRTPIAVATALENLFLAPIRALQYRFAAQRYAAKYLDANSNARLLKEFYLEALSVYEHEHIR